MATTKATMAANLESGSEVFLKTGFPVLSEGKVTHEFADGNLEVRFYSFAGKEYVVFEYDAVSDAYTANTVLGPATLMVSK